MTERGIETPPTRETSASTVSGAGWLVGAAVLSVIVLVVAGAPRNPSFLGWSLRAEGWIGHLIATSCVGAMIGAAAALGASRRVTAIAVTGFALLLVGAEVGQAFFPARSATPADLLSGLVGLVIGVVVFRWLVGRLRRPMQRLLVGVGAVAVLLVSLVATEAAVQPAAMSDPAIRGADPVVVVVPPDDAAPIDGEPGAETPGSEVSVLDELAELEAGSFRRSVPEGTILLPNSRRWTPALPDPCVASSASLATGSGDRPQGHLWHLDGLDRDDPVVVGDDAASPVVRGRVAPGPGTTFRDDTDAALFADARSISASIRDTNAFTIGVRFTPSAALLGPARLVGLSGGVNPIGQNVQLALDGDRLAFRLATACRLVTWIDTGITVPMGAPSTVVVAFDGGVATVHVDGVAAASYRFEDPDLGVWFDALPLVIGNEATLDRPYAGEIHAVFVGPESVDPDGALAVAEALSR